MHHPRKPPHPSCHPLVKLISEETARQGLRERDVMTRAGVSTAQLSNWKRGRGNPNLLTLEAVLNVLGYELQALPAGWDLRRAG